MAAKKTTGDLVPLSTDAITSVAFETLPGWEKLEVRDKDIVINQTKQINTLRDKTKYELGERLHTVREIMKASKMWERWLKEHAHIDRSTAHRAISYYDQQAKLQLPPAIMQEMRRLDITLDENKVKLMPPPKNATPGSPELKTWIEAQTDSKNFVVHTEPPPDNAKAMQSQVMHMVKACFIKLPNNHKAKQKWIHDICAMSLGVLGVSTPQTITPMGIPEELVKRGPGRPRKEA